MKCTKMLMLKVYLLHDFHKCSRDAGQWCSCCPKFAYNTVPAVEMSFVYCTVHTAETKGPNVLPCHIIINFYDAFLAGNSHRLFFSDFLLCCPAASPHNSPLFSNPSGPIPTIPCTSELHQMDVLIYLQGILADLVVADLNPDCAPLPNPPSLSAPASLKPVFFLNK